MDEEFQIKLEVDSSEAHLKVTMPRSTYDRFKAEATNRQEPDVSVAIIRALHESCTWSTARALQTAKRFVTKNKAIFDKVPARHAPK